MTPVLDPLDVDLEVELLQPLPDLRRVLPFLWKGRIVSMSFLKDTIFLCSWAIRIRTLETDFSTRPPPDLDRAGDTEIALRRGDDLATEDMSWETEKEPKNVK